MDTMIKFSWDERKLEKDINCIKRLLRGFYSDLNKWEFKKDFQFETVAHEILKYSYTIYNIISEWNCRYFVESLNDDVSTNIHKDMRLLANSRIIDNFDDIYKITDMNRVKKWLIKYAENDEIKNGVIKAYNQCELEQANNYKMYPSWRKYI